MYALKATLSELQALMNAQSHRYAVVARLSLAMLVAGLLFGVLVMSVDAGDQTPHRIILLFDHSRSMQIGNKDGTGDPYGDAHKLARFLVRYLQATTAPGVVEIGAANFSYQTEDIASPYKVLVPLKPLEDWSDFDIAQIRPAPCPGEGNPLKSMPGKDPCYGTFRSSALSWGEGQLGECTSETAGSCQVVMFTDDLVEEDASETQDQLEESISSLPEGVDLRIVVFPTDGISKTVWHEWTMQQRKDSQKPLVLRPVIDVDADQPEDVYRKLIGYLPVLEAQHFNFLPLPTGEQLIGEWSAPNVGLVELDVIASDPAIGESFNYSPDFQFGSRRIWYNPQVYELRGAFAAHGDGSAGQLPNVVAVRILTRTMPIRVESTIWPEQAKMTEPIEVRAIVHAGARIITDTERLALMARIAGTQADIEMQPNPSSGFWVATIPAAMKGGEFDVSIDLVPKGWSLSEASTASAVTAFVSNEEWKVDLYVDPITGIEGQIRQLEVVVRLGDEIVDLSSQAVVSATLLETGQTVSLSSRNGTWRTTLPITATQNVDAVVLIEGFDPLRAHSKIFVSQAAIGQVIQSSSRTFPFVPLPGEPIEVQVVISTSQPVHPFLYVRKGDNLPTLLPLAEISESHFVATVPRPWSLKDTELYSDSVRLYGDTTVKGALFVLMIYILIIALVFIVAWITRRQKGDYAKTVRALNQAVQGDKKGLEDLIETYTVHDDQVRTELAGQLARAIVQRRSNP